MTLALFINVLIIIIIIIINYTSTAVRDSGVFRTSVRSGRDAVGIEGVRCGEWGWTPPQKKISLMKSSGAF